MTKDRPSLGVILIVAAVVAGAAYSVLSTMLQHAKAAEATGLISLESLAGAALLVLVSFLVERMYPLFQVSATDWIYRFRPAGRIPMRIGGILVQSVAAGLLGAGVGTTTGQLTGVVMFAALAVVSRGAVALLKKRTIPVLLAAGRTSALSKAAAVVPDSDVVSTVVTESQLRWRRGRASSSYVVLTLRRVLRRPHVLLSMLALVLLMVTAVQSFAPYAVFLFLLMWAAVGSDIARCADFGKLGGPAWPTVAALGVHALVAVAVVIALVRPANLLLLLALTVPAVMWTGYKRSRPRRISSFSVVETGVGVSFSPEVFAYYTSGLLPTVVCLFVVVNWAL